MILLAIKHLNVLQEFKRATDVAWTAKTLLHVYEKESFTFRKRPTAHFIQLGNEYFLKADTNWESLFKHAKDTAGKLLKDEKATSFLTR